MKTCVIIIDRPNKREPYREEITLHIALLIKILGNLVQGSVWNGALFNHSYMLKYTSIYKLLPKS